MTLTKRAAGLLLAIFISSSLTTAPAAFAQKKVVPIVDVGRGRCLMGGVRGRDWLEAKDVAPLLGGSERYSVYSFKRRIGVRTGEKPVSEGAPCEDTLYIKNMAPKEREPSLVAIGADWNALPRVPKVESTRSALYRAAVAGVLKRNGILRPQVNIMKVWRVDLDGDGREEVLINATRAKRWNSGSIAADSNAGDYSLVLVRKVIKGKVRNIVIEGEYHPKARNPETDGPPNEFVLSSVLDLNGDGRMEIILEGGYYEGDWKSVYIIQGDQAKGVIGCGCGA